MDCHFLPDKNITDPRPYPPHKAGIKSEDKAFIQFSPPESTYPVLNVDKLIRDDDGTILPLGYYELGLSNDKKFILLSQSKQIIAKVPIYLYKEIEPTEEEKKAEEKKQKKREEYENCVEAKLARKKFDPDKYEKRLELKARLIDYDETYYIIEYRRYNEEAYGAIPKKI